MTTEIFRNTIFEDPARLDAFDFVIFDEVHYLDDLERGTVWEESILFAPQHVRFVALSATVPNVEELAAWIAQVREREVEVVDRDTSARCPSCTRCGSPGADPAASTSCSAMAARGERRRPRARTAAPRAGTGLAAAARRTALRGRPRARDAATCLRYLAERDLLPALYFCFSRRDCERLARAHAGPRPRSRPRRASASSRGSTTSPRATRSSDAPSDARAAPARGARRALPPRGDAADRQGDRRAPLHDGPRAAALHHGDVRARRQHAGAHGGASTRCAKFDGVGVMPLRTRDYGQMAGRAGRQGIDDEGHVFALFDERSLDVARRRATPGRACPSRCAAASTSTTRRSSTSTSASATACSTRGSAPSRGSTGRVAVGRAPKKAPWPPPDEGPGKTSLAGRTIEARLDVLRRFHHLDAKGLTRKGRITSRINGYEIACTEAYEAGVLSRCDSVEAAMLFAAIVYEARPSDDADPPTRSIQGLAAAVPRAHRASSAKRSARRGSPTRARARVPDRRGRAGVGRGRGLRRPRVDVHARAGRPRPRLPHDDPAAPPDVPRAPARAIPRRPSSPRPSAASTATSWTRSASWSWGNRARESASGPGTETSRALCRAGEPRHARSPSRA